jgi:hypothetical protein
VDTGHPAAALAQLMTSMMIQTPPDALAPVVALSPVPQFPALTNSKQFPKWTLKVRALLHTKRWAGINHQVDETPGFADLSSDLYVMLINCLDGDMLEPYLQGGPGLFSHQGITMLQDLISTHQSTSSAGMVSLFTRFLQACMLPSESIIQYCS